MSSFVKATQAYQQGQRTLPGRYYTSPEIYAEEQERIFAARWICVGRAAEIPAAGDYVLRTIAGESVIVVRGRDGALRAFYNVCRHRGTRLCEEPRGRFSETIQCPYHAWTYTIDGQLIGAPHMNEVQGFDKRDYPLHSVQLETWEGFVFVNLAGEPEPFARAFAAVAGRFGRFNLSALTAARRVDYEVAANWKLIFQNYSECLHCPVIHPGLAKLTPYTSGENDLIDWLFHPDAFAAPAFDPDDAVGFWDETNRQDWHICEQSHAGITSRAYVPGPYSPREGIAAAWDREFLRALGHAR